MNQEFPPSIEQMMHGLLLVNKRMRVSLTRDALHLIAKVLKERYVRVNIAADGKLAPIPYNRACSLVVNFSSDGDDNLYVICNVSVTFSLWLERMERNIMWSLGEQSYRSLVFRRPSRVFARLRWRGVWKEELTHQLLSFMPVIVGVANDSLIVDLLS